ncbi:MAG TPA: CotH kinase family protein, partial [Clostridia bacterium]
MKKIISISVAAGMWISAMQSGMANVYAESPKIFINEVMTSNSSTIRDGDKEDAKYGKDGGAYSDWIELYNPGTEPVDMTEYTLADDSETWTFPKGNIPAKGYLLVWASSKNKVTGDGQFHTNFKLSSSGEVITLKTSAGMEMDKVTIGALQNDTSYGRKYDGATEFLVFKKASPGLQNLNDSSETAVGVPKFSHEGGFYQDGFDLSISTPDEGTKIYYTKDGSDPVPGNESTFECTGGIKIKSRAGDPNDLSEIKLEPPPEREDLWEKPSSEVFKCTVIKAVTVRNDGKKSNIVTHSYFVDPNMKSRYNVPVISLVTDKANLFDSEKGIYTTGNCKNDGSDWERPMHIELFEPDGRLGFSQYIGVRINGNYTRYFPQKSFRLYADHKNDPFTNSFKYDVFQGLAKNINGDKLDKFKRLILRNGGNDFEGVLFRDELIQSLVAHLKVDTQAYRPSVVFLDGEYWGIYNIRERDDPEYLNSHYNLDKNKVVILDLFGEIASVQEGTLEDKAIYKSNIVDYLKQNSITEKSTYDYIKTQMDIENFIDYNITQIYVGNTDWPGNNVSIWRYKTDDGKYHPEAPYGQDGRWRWFIKDADYGFGIWGKSPSHDTLGFALGDFVEEGNEYANNPGAVFLLKTLLNNDEFRNEFISRFADQINTSFEAKRVSRRIDEAKAAIEAERQEHYDRWPVRYMGMKYWYYDIESMKSYVSARPDLVRGHMENQFAKYG